MSKEIIVYDIVDDHLQEAEPIEIQNTHRSDTATYFEMNIRILVRWNRRDFHEWWRMQ